MRKKFNEIVQNFEQTESVDKLAEIRESITPTATNYVEEFFNMFPEYDYEDLMSILARVGYSRATILKDTIKDAKEDYFMFLKIIEQCNASEIRPTLEEIPKLLRGAEIRCFDNVINTIDVEYGNILFIIKKEENGDYKLEKQVRVYDANDKFLGYLNELTDIDM